MSDFNDKATVSGSVVSIENGADEVGAKSCVVTIPASLSGVSSVVETQTGRNLLDFSAFSDYSNWEADISDNQSFPTNASYRGLMLNLPIGTYTISFGINSSSFPDYLYLCSDDGSTSVRLINFAKGQTYYTNTGTFTVENGNKYFFRMGSMGTESNFNALIEKFSWGQIEIGSTAHAYEPYQTPTTYTASLGRTIYGGQADIVNGEGQESYGRIIFDGSNDEVWQKHGSIASWFYIDNAITDGYVNASEMDFMICNAGIQEKYTNVTQLTNGQFAFGMPNSSTYRFVFKNTDFTEVADFKAWLSNNNMQVVYKLATPTDFTFTGQEVPTRLGYNAFWSDSGDTELTYYKSGYGYTSVTVHKETPDGEPVEQTAKLHKVIYAGEVDVIKGTAKPKNIWNEDWEVGGINDTTGQPNSETNKIRSKTFFAIEGSKTYYVVAPQNIRVLFYAEDESFISETANIKNSTFTTPSNATKAKIRGTVDYGTTYNNDIAVNRDSTTTDYVPHFDPFTFPPISMETDEGENTLFADEGDSAIIYRKQAE